VPVVLDTNVIIAFHLSTNQHSPNVKIYRLWRNERRLQLIVSDETASEYLEILSRLGVSDKRIKQLKERLERRQTVTHVKLGGRPAVSRDPDDNLVLATALVGKAKFIITNDRDLLDMPASAKRKFKFAVVTPSEFLKAFEAEATG